MRGLTSTAFTINAALSSQAINTFTFNIILNQGNLNYHIFGLTPASLSVRLINYVMCDVSKISVVDDTSLVAKGALAHRLQRLENPKWPPGVWKGVYPKVFGRSKQLSLREASELTSTKLMHRCVS